MTPWFARLHTQKTLKCKIAPKVKLNSAQRKHLAALFLFIHFYDHNADRDGCRRFLQRGIKGIIGKESHTTSVRSVVEVCVALQEASRDLTSQVLSAAHPTEKKKKKKNDRQAFRIKA